MMEQDQAGGEFQPFSAEHGQTVDMYTRFRSFLGTRGPETSKSSHRTLSMASHEITNLDGGHYSRLSYLPRIIDFILEEMAVEHPEDAHLVEELALASDTEDGDRQAHGAGQIIANNYNSQFYDGTKWHPGRRREQLVAARLRYPDEPMLKVTDKFRTMLTQHGFEDSYADDVLAAVSYWYDTMDVVGYRHAAKTSTSGAA